MKKKFNHSGQGTVFTTLLFFRNLRMGPISMLLHLAGKACCDKNGSFLGKFVSFGKNYGLCIELQ